MKKILTIGIMLLFIGTTISSATEINVVEQSKVVTLGGNILYVGGNGTGNYSKIQDAINDSENGDTVFVYDDSAPYYENLNVNKSITLIGENKESTIIDGNIVDKIVVNIFADNVILSDFTIQKFGDYNFSDNNSIISIQSDYNIISNNILTGNTSRGIYISSSFVYGYEYNNISDNIIIGSIGIGIYGDYCNYTTIRNNSISNLGVAISLGWTLNTNIIGNTINGCDFGIDLILTENTYIFGNIITNNDVFGIVSWFGSYNDTIILNTISYNSEGIFIINSHNGEIIKNNFIENDYNANFYISIWLMFIDMSFFGFQSFLPKIHWDGNYWDDLKFQSYFITGFISFFGFNAVIREGILGRIGIMPKNWINIDWHPAQEPYEIPMA
ncbi:MAG: right-handed parallel beta-helix repeat-containing protein [Thermoplasmatales archaeon]|nr:MAG: right-handed parallel beta-helix repeat-containing protein [Thermoplasmatales archaeon]